ncbi:MAG: family 20 glycosylhydrolase [Steroidobacteraceae bacterium]|nr:family 20 glycosylhydrolase [Steroidobacteraceae bacterium]
MKTETRSKKLAALGLAGAITFLAACSGKHEEAPPAPRVAVIPAPLEVASADGAFEYGPGTRVTFEGEGAESAARSFVSFVQSTQGIALEIGEPKGATDTILFALNANAPNAAAEGYTLRVTPEGVTVAAREARGLFYGGVTLWQLMSSRKDSKGIPAMTITDSPRFKWRGLMLDSARHFQSPDYIKKFIDWMSLHKLNVLHWHLVDDQAWRLEIKKYPKLTSVGAWRVPAGQAPAADIDPATRKPRQIGGFYTQDEVRDLVAYAAARHVTIVPEIEMPGHASAAVVAYPELGVSRNLPKAVPSDWGIYTTLFNTDDATFKFLEDVLAETIELFPSEYIHVGGDEAWKDEWIASPKIQAHIKKLGLKDEHELQSYFIQRIGKFIDSKGRKLIGWDEILEGGLAPNATVMSWRGIDGAVAAANAGHDTVLSPAPDLYIDHWQSRGDYSPGRSETLSLEMVYNFNPVPEKITPAQEKHILGLQANLWAEMMRSEDRVTYQAYPRVAALAEVAWSAKSKINWKDFEKRMPAQLARYDALGIGYAKEIPLPAPDPKTRVSHELDLCGGGYVLSLEDDAPIEGPRRAYYVNITDPCWVFKGADLGSSASLRATVGQIPFNFQIGKDADGIPLHKPATRDGELEVYAGGKCEGTPLATLPLAPAVKNFATTTLPDAPLANLSGKQDLCLRFTRAKVDPMWVIDKLEIVEN